MIFFILNIWKENNFIFIHTFVRLLKGIEFNETAIWEEINKTFTKTLFWFYIFIDIRWKAIVHVCTVYFVRFPCTVKEARTMWHYDNRISKLQIKVKIAIKVSYYFDNNSYRQIVLPVSNLFLVSYTKSNAVRSSVDSSGCQKSMITTYLSSKDLLSSRKWRWR